MKTTSFSEHTLVAIGYIIIIVSVISVFVGIISFFIDINTDKREIISFCLFCSIILAAASCIFGSIIARMCWSGDLQHARALEIYWKLTNKAYERTIESQQRTISILKLRLGEE